ncbi:S10 family peptidase [Gemmatimonadota bacterium]
MKKLIQSLMIIGLVVSAGAANAQDTGHIPGLREMELTIERSVVTNHSVRIGGRNVDYTATAGTYVLREDDGTPQATIFYMAYMKDGVEDYTERPLLFSFNGGPGTASVWLHMGVLGPRRVVADPDGFMLQPPYEIVDNEYSILDVADVVFIDPVATGYSRMAPGQDEHMFHGTMEDIESVGEFIRLWTTRNERWESPKFLIGESYGTVRASGLAGHLQGEHLMFLNGVILVSMTELHYDIGSDLNFALILPHFAATAWYHGQLADELQNTPVAEFLDEVEEFALGDYLSALTKGGYVPDSERASIVRRLHHYTSLSPEFINNVNLRIDRERFRKELLRHEGMTVGRLDSRYKGRDRDSGGESIEYDPALVDWEGTYSGVFNQYIRAELGWETDIKYAIWGNVRPWNSDDSVNVGEMLRSAMTQNEYLKVMITEGYYDAACDYFTAEYVFSHLDLTGHLKDRIHFDYYESGHMMYAHIPSLAKMKTDLENFIRGAVRR